jgi:alpha-N-acetylglucosaminidase
MKRILIFWAMMVAAMGAAAIGAPDSQLGADVGQAKALASRLSPALAAKVEFHQIDAEQGHDVFTLESRGGKVAIGGNNAGSMAVGLNRYLNRYCKVTVSWYADVAVKLPKALPDVPVTEQVTARVPQRFFLNYCTWGYTMPFWQWRDW